MECRHCQKLTIGRLLELHQVPLEDENCVEQDVFPANACYHHQPAFQLLRASAQHGCALCQAIFEAFRKDRDCVDDIEKRIKNGLDTSVHICIAFPNRKPEDLEAELFSLLFVKVGLDSWERERENDHGVQEDGGIGLQNLQEMPEDNDTGSDVSDLPDWRWPGRRTKALSLVRPPNPSIELERLRVGEYYLGACLDSPELYEFARKCLRTCLQEHSADRCPKLADRPLPTRVIEICSSGANIVPRLVASAGQLGHYVALSHCWGNKTPLQTTTRSFADNCRGMPFEQFPQTFRDAIIITRELGFRYLWIDSFCILQDSRQDWERESANMNNVYSNAIITIAATASRDCTTGIFDVQREAEPLTTYGALKLYQNSPPNECVRVSTFTGDEDFMCVLFRNPLAKRGWTFQERLLSERVLHYGVRRSYWQCRTAHIAADGNVPDDYAVLGSSYGGLLPLSLTDQTDEEKKNSKSQMRILHDKWFDTIETYCRHRQLTFTTDKLPAVAGLAERFQKLTNDTYMAGIWKADWTRGLLWQTWGHTQSIPDRAPSWSWARWDGNIVFRMRYSETIEDEFIAELLGHQIQVTGVIVFGEIDSEGPLRLTAWTVVRTLAEITDLGALGLDEYNVKPYLTKTDDMITAGGTKEFTVALLGLYLSYTNHEIPREIWERGMLVLKPTRQTSSFPAFERVGAVFHRVDQHGDFNMEGWTRQTLILA